MKFENVIPAYAGIQLTDASKWIPTFVGMTLMFYLLFFPSPAYAQQANLSLSPSSGTFNKGCNFSLKIELNTGGAQTGGTDAIISYDSSRISATSITSGQIYPDYPGNNIDETTGKITISGLAAVSSAFSGTGSLATVNFTVKDSAPEGATQMKFDFDPSNKVETRDSNVVEIDPVADILNSVVNGNYIVGTGACAVGAGTQTPKGGQGAISTPSAQPKNLDQLVDKTGKGPGTPELTYALTIVGAVLTILGILGLALL